MNIAKGGGRGSCPPGLACVFDPGIEDAPPGCVCTPPEEIERRAGSAYRELKEAHHFEHVIPNHDGEDSDNWEAFYIAMLDRYAQHPVYRALKRGTPRDTRHTAQLRAALQGRPELWAR